MVSADINHSFPDASGFSSRNLHYMRRFAEAYPSENYATAVAQIPWGHNIALLEKVDNLEKRLWYAQQTLENGWSRSQLISWIESNLYDRQGKAINNFKKTLPPPQSDLAEQTLKDPYNFSFLSLDKDLSQTCTGAFTLGSPLRCRHLKKDSRNCFTKILYLHKIFFWGKIYVTNLRF